MAVNGVEITLGSKWVNRDGDVVSVAHHSNFQRERWGVAGELNGLVFHYDVSNDGRCSKRNPEICGGDLIRPYVNEVPAPAAPTRAPMTVAGYETLANVLHRAYDQAAVGKGVERHANNLPFHEQPMSTINRALGSIDGFIYQAHKKSLEAKRLPTVERQVAELLGAINYLAGAVIALETAKGSK